MRLCALQAWCFLHVHWNLQNKLLLHAQVDALNWNQCNQLKSTAPLVIDASNWDCYDQIKPTHPTEIEKPNWYWRSKIKMTQPSEINASKWNRRTQLKGNQFGANQFIWKLIRQYKAKWSKKVVCFNPPKSIMNINMN